MISASRRRHQPRFGALLRALKHRGSHLLGLVAPARRQQQTRGAALVSALTVTLLVLAAGMTMWGYVMPDVPVAEKQRQEQARVRPSPELLNSTAPVRLRMPSLDVVAPVVPISLSAEAVLDPPRDPLDVGWWDASAMPGAGLGQTVITGHTVHTGGGSMDRIRELMPREEVDVITYSGVMHYRVERVDVLSRAEVVEQAETLFGQHLGNGRLVLISCTDWNGSFYESNVVVYGKPIGRLGKSRA